MDQIDNFFAQYPEFDYNRQASSPREFYRMCDLFGWEKDRQGNYPPEKEEAHEAFRLAMVESFNARFGTDVNDPMSWENICELLGFDPIPNSVRKMKERVKATHVNLSDLLDGSRSGQRVRIFRSEDELATYTIREGRFFPKNLAYAGGVLRFLLREITGHYEGRGRMGRNRRRNRSTNQ